jgi:apolipoprotein N-acyltransferase
MMNRFLTFKPVWKNMGLALLLGAISGFSMPSFNLWPVLGFSIPLFLSVLEHSKQNFWMGWSFGFGYFLVALHWIAYAFFVDADAYLWMMPFAVGGLCAAAAMYWGLAAWAAKRLHVRGVHLWLAYPFTLGVAELLRGVLITGFPWAVPGLAIDGMGGVAQGASLVGMNGMTFFVLLWAAAPFAWVRGSHKSALIILCTLPALWLWGNIRIAQNPTQFVDGVGIRLVQPNISQSDKWRSDNVRKIYDQLLALSAQPSDLKITHIIWPESAVPFLLDESAEGQAELRPVLQGEKTLITGGVRRSDDGSQYYTSVMVFDGSARKIVQYDKSHLVPGGEYLPLAWLLEPLGFRKVVDVPESFTEGQGPQAIAIPNAGWVSLQICYEAIFPALSHLQNPRPDWIVNVTNDGWFGNSTGPYQHLAQLRLRAIEQGLPIARAANTGISAVIDPVGVYVEKTDLDEVDSRSSRLPQKIQPTVYSLFGEWLPECLSLVLIFCAFFSRKKLKLKE